MLTQDCLRLHEAENKAKRLSESFETNAVVYRVEREDKVGYNAKLEEYWDERDGVIWLTFSKGKLVG